MYRLSYRAAKGDTGEWRSWPASESCELRAKIHVSSKRRVSSSMMLILGAAISADALSTWRYRRRSRCAFVDKLISSSRNAKRNEAEWQKRKQTRERDRKREERVIRAASSWWREKWRRGWRDPGLGVSLKTWKESARIKVLGIPPGLPLSLFLPIFLFFRFWDAQTPCQDSVRRQAHLIYSQSPSILTEVW